MAMTYRRQRIVEFTVRLIRKKDILKKQMEEPEFEMDRERMIGQIRELDTIIRELVNEFDMTEDDFN